MKVALIGYGKMGQMIDAVAKERHIEVVSRVDSRTGPLSVGVVGDADVCIDFSHPSVVLKNIGRLCELGKNIVIGTTGWHEHLDSVKSLVEESGVGAIHSANFSIGMRIFNRLVKEAARLANCVEGYDAGGFEIHHCHKGDSPSGSALAISKVLCSELNGKDKPVFERMDREIMPNELHFASLRVGYSPGTHTVFFDSHADTLELTHRARSREGFAVGALVAAEWIQGKKGLHTMDDVLDTFLQKGKKRG